MKPPPPRRPSGIRQPTAIARKPLVVPVPTRTRVPVFPKGKPDQKAAALKVPAKRPAPSPAKKSVIASPRARTEIKKPGLDKKTSTSKATAGIRNLQAQFLSAAAADQTALEKKPLFVPNRVSALHEANLDEAARDACFCLGRDRKANKLI